MLGSRVDSGLVTIVEILLPLELGSVEVVLACNGCLH